MSYGPQSLIDVAAHPDVDAVMAAIVGAAGLACLAAARSGKRLMLANKGPWSLGAAVRAGRAVGWCHAAAHRQRALGDLQCLPDDRGQWAERIDHIILTASGGPFRCTPLDDLARMTPARACAPQLGDGPKDFGGLGHHDEQGLRGDRGLAGCSICPLADPGGSSPAGIVHSMVVCRDASVLAQLARPTCGCRLQWAWPIPASGPGAAPGLHAIVGADVRAMDPRRFQRSVWPARPSTVPRVRRRSWNAPMK